MTTTGASPEAATVPPGTTALSVENLEVGYGRTTVLRNVSLQVPANSVTALIGPNGAGKTTLLRSVSGLLAVRKGRVVLRGEDITKLEHYRRARRGLCHIPEGRGIYRSLTVRENLRMQAPPGGEGDAIEQAVTVFPVLGKRLSQAAGTMSGGEQQMLAMSAAYLRDAKIIIVDEPSLGLAPVIVDQIFEFLRSVTERGIALLLVDQYVTRVLSMAQSAYVLRRGEVAFGGSPSELLEGDLFKQYIGE
ncbi:MAG TPA: ABC transporter ATP-binding protein [Acidimicrobiales bacterium]|nr:ABC transporter ATP-binding protein [Acidimicrobiales bacterium]